MLNEEHPKFNVYNNEDDREYYLWLWEGETPEKTLAARIMDMSDDIAYAVHDFEDGVWAGMIPLYELLSGSEKAVGELRQRVVGDGHPLFPGESFARTIEELFSSDTVDYLKQGSFDRTRYARAALKDFTAELIDDFITSCTSGGSFVEPEPALQRRMRVLKEMAASWMIRRSDIETYRFGQRRLISRIFDGYWERPSMLPMRDDWILIQNGKGPRVSPKRRLRRLPQRWPEKARFICDHVAGMTDGYARDVYDEMYRATQRRDLRLGY